MGEFVSIHAKIGRFCVIARPLGRSNLNLLPVLDCFASLAVTKMRFFCERLREFYQAK